MSDTYNENPNRFDSTPALGKVTFSTLATPIIKKGEFVYNKNDGTFRVNIGTDSVPVWRKITNS